MNIIVFNHPDYNITGGHKYNQQLFDRLKDVFGCKIIFFPQLVKEYQGWKRFFAPLLELRKIRFICKNDVVFWGDTTFKYHFFLLPLCKLLVHSKNVIIIHHFTYLGASGVKRWFYETIQNIYYRQAGIIIVPSPYTKDIAEKELGTVQINYIPLPFDNSYCPSSSYNTGELLFVGAIEPRKGLHILLKALDIIKKDGKSFNLNVVGKVVDEKYYDELICYVKEHKLNTNINFRGRVSLDQLNDFYSKAEMFTFPSLLEGYGMVLVEALHHGLPIIAFDNSAMPYTIQNGVNGYLARNFDVTDFANQIMKVLHNVDERRRLQKGIKETLTLVKTEKDFNESVDRFYYTLLNDSIDN